MMLRLFGLSGCKMQITNSEEVCGSTVKFNCYRKYLNLTPGVKPGRNTNVGHTCQNLESCLSFAIEGEKSQQDNI